MSGFTMNLCNASQQIRIGGVDVFVGEDASGSFGIRAHHVRFMTALVFGLARFRQTKGDWQYLAVPGAILYFSDNELTLSARHFLIDSDLDRITASLDQELIVEEENLKATRESLRRMEQAMLKQMLELQRKTGWQL